jgi:predicted nucleotidyltransferase
MPGKALQIDTDIPVCGSSVAADAVRSYLRKACVLILDELGEEAVASIVVSGSATMGEFTAVETADGGLLLLSDADLAVITRGHSESDAAKSVRPALLTKLDAIDEALLMCAPADIGIYSPGDLKAQSMKMGVLEMRTTGKVLWGDRDALEGLPGFGPKDISKWEAVVLLQNRCLESLRAAGEPASRARCGALNLLYAGAKAYLDAGTSLAAFYGRYVTGYRRRLDPIAETVRDHCGEGFGTIGAEAFLEGLRFWTDFKVEGDLARVSARYGVAGDSRLKDTALKAWRESLIPVAEVWRVLAGALRARPESGLTETCRGLIGFEPAVQRLRGWKRLVRAGEVPFSRALRLSRSGSPLHLLRLSAFCLLGQFMKNDPHAPMDEDARAFLEEYFPGRSLRASETNSSEQWRGLIVDAWSRWTKRFWS